MKGKLNEDIDKKIIGSLNKKAEEMSVSENMFFKIKNDIRKEDEGGFLNMRFGFLKVKTLIIVGVLCIATTITCVAATNGFQWISTSSKASKINQFPTGDSIKKMIGYLPKYVESFEGGFKFDSLNFSNSSLEDESGKVVIKAKNANFEYKKDGAKKNQSLFMTATAIDKAYFNKEIESNRDVTEFNGIKIYYSNIQRKIVPADYKQTEEDIKLIKEGLLDIAFGSDEIQEYNSQSVAWYDSGIEYLITNNAYDEVDKSAMIKMAETVINQ
ncbi:MULTISPECIES: hypothetical protein [unclassified Clostridium]|uniref:hypothetical protein n=1 Tax=unclassified Clostridium TaxID=2614128 RepID=UPI0002984817|nr:MULTISPECIES: hypothetical protein [unclassified Clostridium]EKQ58292.1 MAG: hypothetical protein A370_00007 [Clostridium sp. Maddingley MBC34-26]